jgi:hypothetical protein
MPAHAAFLAHFGLAFVAKTEPSAGCSVHFHVLWFDPFAATFGGTVQPILRGVFCKLVIP